MNVLDEDGVGKSELSKSIDRFNKEQKNKKASIQAAGITHKIRKHLGNNA